MERNKELFLKIADAIEKQPHLYDQSVWGRKLFNGCGTAHCIAGHAAALSGCKPEPRDPRDNSKFPDWGWVKTPDGNRFRAVSDVAQELLGITREEAIDLFDSEWIPPNEYKSVPEALRAFANGADIEWGEEEEED